MNVLCVMAHPDDEVLGCGGTLAKHGGHVHIFCTTRASEELTAACAVLGATATRSYYSDQALDREPFSELVEAIDAQDFGPDVIYTHHPGDLNQDHALVARAVLTAFRPKPGEKPVRIMACEVASSTEWTFPSRFQPNWFEALTAAQMTKKVKAMECYPSETKEWPHPRSREALYTALTYRGVQAGVDYAEAFQLLRAGPF